LDPGATGVLLVGVGRVTRLLRFLTALPKTYTCEVVFGIETSTLDADGEIVGRHDMAALDTGAVGVAASRFVGEIDQVPPMVSAVKVGGRRLHEIARAGEEVERAPRRVTVHALETAATDDPSVYRMRVECSSGTYVRSLAADLGHALGGGAHLRALRRTAIGSFGLADAVAFGKETVREELTVLTPAESMRDYPAITVDAVGAAAVGHGKVLSRGDVHAPGDGPWAVLDSDGRLLAMYEPRDERTVKPAVVLAGGDSVQG
jgi:tRNA pseudouridine55 synthase